MATTSRLVRNLSCRSNSKLRITLFLSDFASFAASQSPPFESREPGTSAWLDDRETRHRDRLPGLSDTRACGSPHRAPQCTPQNFVVGSQPRPGSLANIPPECLCSKSSLHPSGACQDI